MVTYLITNKRNAAIFSTRIDLSSFYSYKKCDLIDRKIDPRGKVQIQDGLPTFKWNLSHQDRSIIKGDIASTISDGRFLSTFQKYQMDCVMTTNK